MSSLFKALFELEANNGRAALCTVVRASGSTPRHATSKMLVYPDGRILGSVGEPINPEAWMWYYNVIGKGKCPIVDTYWQTETGGVIITPLPGATPLKPGSACMPFPGVIPVVLREDGSQAAVNEGGYLAIKRPWPGLMRRVYGDSERFKKTYFERFPGMYSTGDSARVDEDGFLWLMGRIDDVIKISGHRIGTAEVESALVSHPAVAEAGVIGKPDPTRGEIIKAFIALKPGKKASERLKKEIQDFVKKELAGHAYPREIEFIDKLPKTRSGKIVRRLLKAKELGLPIGDVSALEEY